MMDAKKLLEIIEAHRLWLLGEEAGRYANLSDANLSGANLRGANLRGANLSGANLLPDLHLLRLQPQETVLRAWKFLDGGVSPFQGVTYEVGKVYTEKDFSTDERETCDKGLNVATLQWCIAWSSGNSEFIEVEFYAKDIVAVPFATDGKFRVKRFKVLRKIDKNKASEIISKFTDKYTKDGDPK